MNVNYEFLDQEAIENVITCMHFKFDKVVCFGYPAVIQKQKNCTERFLKKYCGVQSVSFISMPENNLQTTLRIMQDEIEKELKQARELYFDLTGGESLILAAFGILSRKYETPMHMYDIPENRLIDLDSSTKRHIQKNVPAQNIKMNLERFIELKGGVINNSLQKEFKKMTDPVFAQDIQKIWDIASSDWNYWNPFSDFLKNHFNPDDTLQVAAHASEVVRNLRNSHTILDSPRELNNLLDAMGEAGILLDVIHADGNYGFKYKNQEIKNCLCDGGSILELYTFLNEKPGSDDCRTGVHLDWDGTIHKEWGADVLNEIDVLTLRGNIPTFISCKTGKMNQGKTLHALYELDTVAKQFGGKYAKKVLAVVKPLGDIYLERASEMGIEVREHLSPARNN